MIIDEIKAKYSNYEDTHFVSTEICIELLSDLEQLRPLVELGECFATGAIPDGDGYRWDIDIPKVNTIIKLIQQIQEQEK